MFPENDNNLEERQFSNLHKIILGITLQNLSAELAVSGAEIDNVDSKGNTPLMWAVRRSDSLAVDLLLKAGATPNPRGINGKSALMTAIFWPLTGSSLACVKLLLEAGADPIHKNKDGYNALHAAAAFHNSKEMIEYLVAAGVNIHERNFHGSMPLGQAAIRNHAFSAEALLECGADIDPRNNDGDTPLHESFHNYAHDVMKLLLIRGAKYTLPCSTGGTILHLAALSGSLKILEILQAACLRGIDPDHTDHQKKTPLQIAQERVMKEEGFVQKLQTLLYEIRIRNASQIRSPEAEDILADAVADPSQVPASNPSNTATSGFSIWTRLTSHPSAPRNLKGWTREWYTKLLTQLTQSKWVFFTMYWLLGLGWAGFVYMLLFPRRVGSGEQAGDVEI